MIMRAGMRFFKDGRRSQQKQLKSHLPLKATISFTSHGWGLCQPNLCHISGLFVQQHRFRSTGKKMPAIVLWDKGYPGLLEYIKEHGNALVPFDYKSKDGTLLGEWVDRQRMEYVGNSLSSKHIQKLDTVEVGFIWERSDEWLERYEELLEYKEKHGNTLVPSSYEANPPLGLWVYTQRKKYKANNLSSQRIDALNKIGFVWNFYEEKWWGLYKQLLQYKKDQGDTLVPRDYKPNPSLGKWVHMQRRVYKANNLSSERTNALDEIGFVWDHLEDRWSKRFKELLEYKDTYDNTLVPKRYKENRSLGLWVQTQRNEYKAGRLSPERIDALNEIEFVWAPLDDQWSKRYEELRKYKKDHGGTLVPASFKENHSLCTWVDEQRKACRAGKLSQERINALNAIEFVWNPYEDQWSERYKELLQYKKDYGDTLVPQEYEANPPLGEWVSTQRKEYKANTISDKRADALNEIKFVWDAQEDQWSKRYEELRRYIKDHGDALVPSRFKENPSLGTWVRTQRNEYKARRLSQERIDALNAIEFVWYDPRGDYLALQKLMGSDLLKNLGSTKIH